MIVAYDDLIKKLNVEIYELVWWVHRNGYIFDADVPASEPISPSKMYWYVSHGERCGYLWSTKDGTMLTLESDSVMDEEESDRFIHDHLSTGMLPELIMEFMLV